MEKPTILKLKETEDKIIEIINTCGVPVFVLRPSMEKILSQLQMLEQQELNRETAAYNEAVKAEELKKESGK